MRYFLLLFTLFSFAQEKYNVVPEKYWLNDKTFNDNVTASKVYDDSNEGVVVIEFWANFNKDNCFKQWNSIENASYYRIDIAEAPLLKKKYRIRMAPTLIIFKNGVKEAVFKAGLDLIMPTDLSEIQRTINEIKKADKF